MSHDTLQETAAQDLPLLGIDASVPVSFDIRALSPEEVRAVAGGPQIENDQP